MKVIKRMKETNEWKVSTKINQSQQRVTSILINFTRMFSSIINAILT